MPTQKTNAYLKTQILTAPPEKLQLMLYEGAIRFALQAKNQMIAGNFEQSYDLLVRAQNIVLELICGLRPESDPSLCKKLASLYFFIYRRLVEANVMHKTSAVDDAVKILEIQRDTWRELLEKLAEERSGGEVLEVSLNAKA
jgi:flagellar protein FliS